MCSWQLASVQQPCLSATLQHYALHCAATLAAKRLQQPCVMRSCTKVSCMVHLEVQATMPSVVIHRPPQSALRAKLRSPEPMQVPKMVPLSSSGSSSNCTRRKSRMWRSTRTVDGASGPKRTCSRQRNHHHHHHHQGQWQQHL